MTGWRMAPVVEIRMICLQIEPRRFHRLCSGRICGLEAADMLSNQVTDRARKLRPAMAILVVTPAAAATLLSDAEADQL